MLQMKWVYGIAIVASIFSQMALSVELKITDTAVRQPLPGRTVSVGYLTIENSSAQSVQLLKATSPQFGNIELHNHQMVDGMMKMIRLKELQIPQGEVVKLQPGGLHLMMFRPTHTLVAGEEIQIDLHWSDNTIQSYRTQVVPVPKQ